MHKETKKIERRQPPQAGLPVINVHAAGIDISAKMHMVAVPEGRAECSIRQFGCFTEDLHAIAQWLKGCKIETIAMESTGVYWKPLFTLLQEYGFEVLLVNAKQIKNINGRKTDKEDARWIQRLHSCGLLNSSFLPDEATEKLRALVRHRKTLLEDGSRYVLRMEKSLELMNIKIQGVISDLMGKTGRAIVEAILAGSRNGADFIALVDPRIKASGETIIKSLEGNWNEQQLFLLRENYDLYKYIQQSILRCDQQIEAQLQINSAAASDGIIEPAEGSPSQKKRSSSKNKPSFDTIAYLNKILGVNVTDIYGISAISALQIVSEIGTDLSRWENEKKFVSWLNLCPNNKITGGKLISSTVMKKKAGISTQAFRAAANALQRSPNYLGHYFRKMKAKGGNKYAIIATARKLAIIYYKMVRYKKPFTPIKLEEYQDAIKKQKIKKLQRQLAQLQSAA